MTPFLGGPFGVRERGVKGMKWGVRTPQSPKEEKELQAQKAKMMDQYQQDLAKHQGILLRHRGQAAEVTKRVNRLRKLANRFERAGNKPDALKMKNRINALLGESKKQEVGVKGMKWGEQKNGKDPKASVRIGGAMGVAKHYGFEENPKLPGRMSDDKGNAISWDKKDGSWQLQSAEHGIHAGKDSADLYQKLEGLGLGSKQVAASVRRKKLRHGKRTREKFFSPRYSGTNPEGDLRKRESRLHRSRESRGPIVLPFMKGQRKDEGTGWVRPGVYVIRRPEPSELTGGVVIKEF